MTRVSGPVSAAAIAAVLSCSIVPVAAQQPGLQAEITVLRAARLLDVRGGRMVEGGVIVVQGGKITAVGGAAPAGARVIDLGDATLAPGLIDLHTHLTMDIEGNWVMREVTEGAADGALRGARNARATVEAGFTTVRNLGSQDFSDIALARAIAAVRAGVTSIEHGSILDDEAIAMMKERGTYLVPTSYLADALNREALPPPIKAKEEAVLPIMRESLRKAIAAGVKVALGTDAAVYPHGHNGREIGVYVALGMTPIDAVRSATTVAAEALGVTDRGAIETGMLADIIAVAGNPLQDVKAFEQVRFVMVGGTVLVRR